MRVEAGGDEVVDDQRDAVIRRRRVSARRRGPPCRDLGAEVVENGLDGVEVGRARIGRHAGDDLVLHIDEQEGCVRQVDRPPEGRWSGHFLFGGERTFVVTIVCERKKTGQSRDKCWKGIKLGSSREMVFITALISTRRP